MASPGQKRGRASSPSPSEDAKRARLDSDSCSSPALTWDDKYCFEDGSCILQVEDTLFKLHKSRLAKDDSVFSSLFSLPTGDSHTMGRSALGVGDGDGTSAASPIVLTGDTASAFRNFCWALYALPSEVKFLINSPKPLPRMIDIAHVSHKYAFSSLQNWILELIQQHISCTPSPLLSSVKVSEYTFPKDPDTPVTEANTEIGTFWLIQLTRLASLCDHTKTMNALVTVFEELMSSSLQHAYLAMTLADELDIQSLRGPAYFEVACAAPLVNMRTVDELLGTGDTGSAQDNDRHPVLTPNQQVRLLSGYYRLSKAWEIFQKNAPPLEHSPTCHGFSRQQKCLNSWRSTWKNIVPGSVSEMGIRGMRTGIKAIQQRCAERSTSFTSYSTCIEGAFERVEPVTKRFELKLADFFSD